MFPVTKPQQCVSAASLTSNVDTETVNTTRFVVQNPDCDRNLQFTVCRACLAMSGKMYHMSEHKLSVMYQQVTGVEMNTEDKLPKMLCWECVARLSSANNFKNKALKSHWILLNNINGGKFMTMSDIESVDRAQYQLESTLGFKYYKVNNIDLHIQKESDITSEVYDASNVELWINKYDDEFIEEVEQCAIKSELLDVTEQQEETELQVTIPIIIKENLSHKEVTSDSIINAREKPEEENPAVHKDKEVCESIKQEQKDLSVTPLSNWSEGLSYNKELRVVLEDVMLSLRKLNTQDSFRMVTNNCVSYQKAQSTVNKETVTHPTIYKATLTNTNNMDTDSTDTTEAATFIQTSPKYTSTRICASTSNVNDSTDVSHYDAESSKHIFICDICKKSFHIKSSLKQHIQGHFYLLSCSYCEYKTCRKKYLTNHINCKHTKNICFNCSYCSHTAYSKHDLNKHVNRKHTQNTVFDCCYCDYKSYRKSDLSSHVNAKHTQNTVFDCSHCDYKAYFKSALNQHVNAKHTKNTVFDCSYCDYKAYRKSHLSSHINAKHTQNTVFDCSHCDYKAYRKSHLSSHVNAKHTQNTIFDCSHCDYKAYFKSVLNQHVNAKHTKNTVFDCSYCDYKAYDKSTLNKHVNYKHTKNTVYYCSYCSYKTLYRSGITRHLNSKH